MSHFCHFSNFVVVLVMKNMRTWYLVLLKQRKLEWTFQESPGIYSAGNNLCLSLKPRSTINRVNVVQSYVLKLNLTPDITPYLVCKNVKNETKLERVWSFPPHQPIMAFFLTKSAAKIPRVNVTKNPFPRSIPSPFQNFQSKLFVLPIFNTFLCQIVKRKLFINFSDIMIFENIIKHFEYNTGVHAKHFFMNRLVENISVRCIIIFIDIS